jgi:geranylgeranyl diphosphate synthase type I
MTLKLINDMQIAVEKELQSQIDRLNEPNTNEFYEMMTYHMGWSGEGLGENTSGKRIRPLLLLLCSASGNHEYAWQNALPGAAAVELLHNFSLVHDDIQDNSDKRRNRPTVWRKWGMPQAINAGDGLYALSNLAIIDLIRKNPPDIVVQTARIFHNTCLNLTRGQYMDMSFESRNNLTLEDYWPMITHKTAALISASTEIGANLAGFDEKILEVYRQFGHYLGLAFQIRDDILGIWGVETQTGKSVINDLITGKKTLPVLYGMQKKDIFARRWSEGNITADEVPVIADQLAKEGARLHTEEIADQMTDMALKFLNIMSPQGSAGEALFDLTIRLLKRET